MNEIKKNIFSFNDYVNTYLKSIIKSKSFANGYIFCGAAGVGKKKAALQFIKEIFKQSSKNDNVEENINNHPDFLIIEPITLLETKRSKNPDVGQTKSGSEIIKIAQIRNIKIFLVKDQSIRKRKLS